MSNKLTYGSDIVSAIQNLKRADHHFSSFQDDYPGSKGAGFFKVYRRSIKFILGDIATIPSFTDAIRTAIRNEINSDVFAPLAIQEKIALLSPSKREFAESIIDALLADEPIELEIKKEVAY